MKITRKQFDTWINDLNNTLYTYNVSFGRSYKRSPILGIKAMLENLPARLSDFQFPWNIALDLSSGYGYVDYDSGVYLNTLRVYSADHIEKVLLHTVCRTKFESMQVVRGRYNLDFTKMNPELISKLITHILDPEAKRINYSWLVPLQNIVLESKHHTPTKKKVTINSSNTRRYKKSAPEPLASVDDDWGMIESPSRIYVDPAPQDEKQHSIANTRGNWFVSQGTASSVPSEPKQVRYEIPKYILDAQKQIARNMANRKSTSTVFDNLHTW